MVSAPQATRVTPVMASPYTGYAHHGGGGAAAAAPVRAIVKAAPATAATVQRSRPVVLATTGVPAASASHAVAVKVERPPSPADGEQRVKVEKDARGRHASNGQQHAAATASAAQPPTTAHSTGGAGKPPVPAATPPPPMHIYNHLFTHSSHSSFTTPPPPNPATATAPAAVPARTNRTPQPLYPNSSVGPDGPSRSLCCRHMFIPYHIFYDVRRQLLGVLGVGAEDEHWFLNPQMGEGEVRQRWGEMQERRRREGEDKEREAKRAADEEQARQQQVLQQMLPTGAPHTMYAPPGIAVPGGPVAYYDASGAAQGQYVGQGGHPQQQQQQQQLVYTAGPAPPPSAVYMYDPQQQPTQTTMQAQPHPGMYYQPQQPPGMQMQYVPPTATGQPPQAGAPAGYYAAAPGQPTVMYGQPGPVPYEQQAAAYYAQPAPQPSAQQSASYAQQQQQQQLMQPPQPYVTAGQPGAAPQAAAQQQQYEQQWPAGYYPPQQAMSYMDPAAAAQQQQMAAMGYAQQQPQQVMMAPQGMTMFVR